MADGVIPNSRRQAAIGAWTSALALDWLGGKRGGQAADWLIAHGAALSGPTAHPQPAVQVRVRDGKVEVRQANQS